MPFECYLFGIFRYLILSKSIRESKKCHLGLRFHEGKIVKSPPCNIGGKFRRTDCR